MVIFPRNVLHEIAKCVTSRHEGARAAVTCTIPYVLHSYAPGERIVADVRRSVLRYGDVRA